MARPEQRKARKDYPREWQEAYDDYQSEITRIVEEADGLIGEMPE